MSGAEWRAQALRFAAEEFAAHLLLQFQGLAACGDDEVRGKVRSAFAAM